MTGRELAYVQADASPRRTPGCLRIVQTAGDDLVRSGKGDVSRSRGKQMAHDIATSGSTSSASDRRTERGKGQELTRQLQIEH
jgi:hypothetical protein